MWGVPRSESGAVGAARRLLRRAVGRRRCRGRLQPLRRAAGVIALGVAACVAGPARAAEHVYSFALDEAQVVPPTGSAATGRGKARLSADENTVLFVIEHSVTDAFAASVQLGDFGENGPLVYRFTAHSGLVLEQPTDCPGEIGELVTVQLWMRRLPQRVTAFQALLEYDTERLVFRPDLSVYANNPFPLHIQPMSVVETTPGQLNLDGSGPLMYPPWPGTQNDALLATLRFQVAAPCAAQLAAIGATESFHSELSFEGDPVETVSTAGLTVTVNSACTNAANDTIEVELWMRDLPSPITGYQAFVAFDNRVLSYRGDLSSYAPGPFGLHVQHVATAELSPGIVNLDGSAALQTPPFPGTMDDTLLARLRFDIVGACELSLVRFRDDPSFESVVSYEGTAVATGNPALSPIVATWHPTAQNVADLKAGRLYVRIDSLANPDADIRGQIAPKREPEPGDVILSEIMYNPASDTGDPSAAEWIELFNNSVSDIDLTGWYFQDEDAAPGDPCAPLRSGSFPPFVLGSYQLVVVIPQGTPGHAPTPASLRTAWGLPPTAPVIQTGSDGTAGGALAGAALADDPRNDQNDANDLPLADFTTSPCAPGEPPRPDNEILTLTDGDKVIDVVNYDDDVDDVLDSDWPPNTGISSITLVPVDYPAATDVSSYSAAGNDLGSNWRAHSHGDPAGGIRQVVSAGVYAGSDVGSPTYLYGATDGNRAPAAISKKVLLGPGQTIDILLDATDHSRPFFGFLLFFVDSLPANGQLIDVPSNHLITPADVVGDGYLMPHVPFNHLRYVNNGTCGATTFVFRANDGLLASQPAEVELIVQCGGPAITELMYDPASAEGAPPVTEWIELFNPTDRPIDLAGWYFSDGALRSGEFPQYILAGWSAVVVVPHGTPATEFAAAWSAPALALTDVGASPTAGLTGAGLDNRAGDVRLILPGGPLSRVGDAVCYTRGADDPAWPDVGDGGPSIYITPAAGYTVLSNDAPSAWAASQAGVHGAYASTPAGVFTAVDTGSPGYLAGRTQGVCTDSPAFDGNQDGVIDLTDFAHFALCHRGVGVTPPLNCGCFDADADGDVDFADFGPMQSQDWE